MRIGIDAKSFFHGPVSTRVVLQNLLPELVAGFPEHEWVIFLDARDRSIPFPVTSPQVQRVYLWAGVNGLSNAFLLGAKARKAAVDVIVYQTFASLGHQVPAVSFIHDVLFRDHPRFFSWKERLYFSPIPWFTRHRSDRLIATTGFVAAELLKFGYTDRRENIDLVPLGVNATYRPAEALDPVARETVRNKFALPAKYLLFVGRLNVRKNIEHLLKAIPLLDDPVIPLLIVGTADWKTPDLQQLIADPRIGPRVTLTGAMTDDELVVTYALATVFCFPSFAEGFGLPPLEAMAAGVPVIVSHTTAMPEVCGDAAVYIDPQRHESIAEAINGLLKDSVRYAAHREKGLRQARKYPWSVSARAFMDSVKKAAGARKFS